MEYHSLEIIFYDSAGDSTECVFTNMPAMPRYFARINTSGISWTNIALAYSQKKSIIIIGETCGVALDDNILSIFVICAIGKKPHEAATHYVQIDRGNFYQTIKINNMSRKTTDTAALRKSIENPRCTMTASYAVPEIDDYCDFDDELYDLDDIYYDDEFYDVDDEELFDA